MSSPKGKSKRFGERKGREKRGRLPESSSLGAVAGCESAMSSSARMMGITDPPVKSESSPLKAVAKRSCNMGQETTNQYSD